MPTRDELIARKAEVQARMRNLRRQLEAGAASADGTKGIRRALYSARRSSLEGELEELMVEESRLRLEIDRTAR